MGVTRIVADTVSTDDDAAAELIAKSVGSRDDIVVNSSGA